MLPTLRKNSAYRLAHDSNFKEFLLKQESQRVRLGGIPVNTIDEQLQIGMDDLQMQEAVNVVKDMILFEAENRPSVAKESALLKTGSDS
jgi:carboxyl-terminal processing protease